jgi:hypothetical protein
MWTVAVVAALALGFVLRSLLLPPGRYITAVRHAPRTPISHAGDTSELDATLETIRANAEAGGLLAGIEEIIHLELDGRVAYTVTLHEGKGRIDKGAAPGIEPTLVVPIVPRYLENLKEIVADQKLDDRERFNVGYVLLVPCLERIHRMFYFADPGDKEAFGVDDYMQFAIANPEGFTYYAEPDTKIEIAATVVNADGYFFYQRGLIGDPDVRYEFTFDGALELYRILIYQAERSKNDNAALFAMGRTVSERLAQAITYQRGWH